MEAIPTPASPPLTLIVVHDKNLCIGKNNDLLFRLKKDLQRFKAMTMGKPIIMGRKTYESIGRPLPGRCNIIVSRTMEDNLSGCKVCSTLEEAIAYAIKNIIDSERMSGKSNIKREIMIIGGGDIYQQTLPLASKLLVTEVELAGEGDTYFPEYSGSEWREEQAEHYDDGGIPCVFKVLARVA